jgi:hypothetical protein
VDAPVSDPAPQRPPPEDAGARVRPMVLFRSGVYASLGVLATAAAAVAVYTARGVLIWALIALFLAVSLDPAVRALTRWHIRRGIAIAVVVLVVLGMVAAFLQSVIPAMADQFHAMVKDFPHYLAIQQHRSAGLRQISDRYHLTSQLNKLLASLPARLGSGAFGISRRVFSALAATLTVTVLTIYFLVDLPRLQRSAVLLFPRAHRARFGHIGDVLVDKVGSYMIGNILISLVAGLAAFGALAALGVPFAVPLAFLVAVTDLIPIVRADRASARMTAGCDRLGLLPGLVRDLPWLGRMAPEGMVLVDHAGQPGRVGRLRRLCRRCLHQPGHRPGAQRQRASTQTLIGAVCFFIGALLLLPERTEKTHGQVMAAGDQGAIDVG